MKKNQNNSFFTNLPDFEMQAIEEKRRAMTPPAPSFSLEDMEAARKGAFEKGRAQGLQEARDSIEQKTQTLIQSVIGNIHALENAELQRQQEYIDSAIQIAYKAVEKLLQPLLNSQKQNLINQALSDFMDAHTPKTGLKLTVHPKMVEETAKHIKTLRTAIDLQGDEMLSEMECKLQWSDGAFDFNPQPMVEAILRIVENYQGESKALDDKDKNDHTEKNDPIDNTDHSDTPS